MLKQAVRPRCRLVASSAAAVVLAAVTSAFSADPVWRTGPALRAQLDQQIAYNGGEVPLRDALRSISRSQQVAILLDRRVDPDQRLSVNLAGVSLRMALEQIAAQGGAAITATAELVYIGPQSTAQLLRTLLAVRDSEVARLPNAPRKRLQQAGPSSWADLATPRDLLAGFAREAGLQLSGLDQVPHDLWAGADLPPLSPTQRLSLVAVQFDLTFQTSADGQQATLVPLPADVTIERTYAAGARPQQRIAQWSRLCPGCQVKLQGDRIVVRGLLEDHEQIASPVAASPPRPAPAGEQRYTLTVKEQPIGKLIEALSRQLNVRIRLDQAAIAQAGISLDQRVSLQVNQVTLDALLEAALRPAGLISRKEGDEIVVTPAR